MKVGNIDSYYGGLHIFAKNGKFYWILQDQDTCFDDLTEWEEISESTYNELLNVGYLKELEFFYYDNEVEQHLQKVIENLRVSFSVCPKTGGENCLKLVENLLELIQHHSRKSAWAWKDSENHEKGTLEYNEFTQLSGYHNKIVHTCKHGIESVFEIITANLGKL